MALPRSITTDLYHSRPDRAALYLLIRAAIVERNTPETTQSLARMLDLSCRTVARNVESLVKAGLVTVKNQAELWATDGASPEPMLNRVDPSAQRILDFEERIKAEHRGVLARQIKKSMGRKTAPSRAASQRLLAKFLELYSETYGEKLPVNKNKALAYMKRILEWVNGDADHAVDVFRFMFERWSDVKTHLKIRDIRPTLGIVGSASWWQQIRMLWLNGIPVTRDSRLRTKDKDGELFGW